MAGNWDEKKVEQYREALDRMTAAGWYKSTWDETPRNVERERDGVTERESGTMLLAQACYLAQQIAAVSPHDRRYQWTVIAIVRVSDDPTRREYTVTAVDPTGQEHTYREPGEWTS